MFIYLSKKIAIPNSTKLNCMAWNKEHGYIACGGNDGLLKCLLLDSSKFEPNYAGKDRAASYPANAPTNLTMNQTLEGHTGNIQVITWNETHQKLTSSDQSGLIIVWMLYKGSWYEEMINNRNKSVVRGMAWNSDGQKICIVYEDGAVIVGSVDGNRIWGRELKIGLTGVEWSPDGRMLLFAIHNGEIHAYDNQGNYIMKLNIQVLSESLPSTYSVIGIQWYNGKYGYIEPDVPTLAICYSNGCLQIMRGESDDMPVLLDMGMAAMCCRWNRDGSILAVTGKIVQPGPNKDINLIQFFSPYGEHLRTLKIPGRDVACCDWEGNSLKIAIAADSYIFFGNIRPSYKWAYFENVLVFSYHSPDRSDTTLCFWDTKKEEAYIKHVKSLRSVAACGHHCVLGTKADDPSAGAGNYTLVLCNSLSTSVDTKYVEFDPLNTAMNATHVVACSRDNFLVWSYASRSKHLPGTLRFRKERMYHIDDTPSGVSEVIQDLDHSYQPAISTEPTSDPISCLAMSDVCLVIGRESGMLQRYVLPQVALVQRYSLRARPYRIAINCNSTRLSIIDHTGLLTYLDMDTQVVLRRGEVESTNNKSEATKAIAEFDRKDVWGMHWASDNPELIAIMEKTRMYIFRGVEPEEPISSHGYICSFKDLEIRVALLDEIIKSPEPPFTAHIQDLEVKSLRDTRNLLDKVGIPEATIFIEENSHPRLWRLLAMKALQALDLVTAEAAFVRCSDYPGILLTRKLQSIQHATVKQAEIAAHLKDFDTAQALYLQVDRRDLAIELRETLGDWRHVVDLLKAGPGGTDSQLKAAYIRVGDDCAEKKNWIEARKYYEDGGSMEKLVNCYFNMEDYNSLQAMATNLPENHALLMTLGQMFATVGMCTSAVDAYLKCNCVKEAVDVCVTLNQWDQAVDLAKRHKFLDTKDLLTKYAEHLLTKNQTMKAIELYHKAHRFLEAAKLLYQMAGEESKKRTSPLIVKRLYVLAALAVGEHTASMTLRPNTARVSGNEKAVLQELKLIDTAWHGAIANHFLALAHRQLYLDQVDSALKTALHLREYENIIDPETIFSIIALASVGNRAFGTCSRAFIKLETLENLSEVKKLEYEELGMTLFTKYPPRDGRANRSECTKCETMIPDTCSVCLSCGLNFPACAVTGRSLINPSHVWTCHVCQQSAWDQYIRVRYCCPLCYTPIRL